MKYSWLAIVLTFISSPRINAQISLPSFQEPQQLTFSEYDSKLARNTRGSMMFDRAEDLHLVYTEQEEGSANIGSSGKIYYRKRAGNRWSDPFAVRSDTGQAPPFGHGGNPSLYAKDDGSVHFVWHDYRNSTTPSGLNNIDIYYRRLSPSGVFESPEIQITSHSENQYRPKIFGMPDGRIAVGWYDFFREEGPDFLLTISDPQGRFDTAETFEIRLVNDANIDKEPIPGSHFFLGVVIPQFVIDSQGHLHAVWTTGFVDAQGTLNYGMAPSLPDRSMQSVVRLSESGSSFYDPPKVRVDANDNVWIVWTERVESRYHNIWLTWKEPYVSSFHEPVSLTDYNLPGVASSPDITIASNGTAYIVWSDERDGEGDLFLRKFDPVVESLSDEVRLTDAWEFADTRPCIDISRQGEIAIVWQRTQEGNTDLFFMQSEIDTSVNVWRFFE